MPVSDMRKFILKILCFFGVVIAVDYVVGVVGDYMQHHSKPGPIKQMDDLIFNESFDVLIMGSSRARHHYVPSIFRDSLHCDVYNAGFDGNGVILAYGLLGLIVSHHSPKLVVYDIEPSFDLFENANDENNSRYLTELRPFGRSEWIDSFSKEISYFEPFKKNSNLYRYNSKLPYSFVEFIKPMRVFPDGYFPIEKTMDPYKVITYPQENIDLKKLEFVRRFIDFCSENGIKLVICFSPKYGKTGSTELAPIIELCQINDVPVFDFYAASFFMDRPELFAEPMHLNKHGAEEYSQKIVTLIKKEYEKD